MLFPVLFVIAIFIVNTPEENEPDAKWSAYFASSSHQTTLVISSFLLVIAALCLLAFLTSLWSLIATAHRPETLSPLGLVASVVAAACIAIGGVANSFVAGGMVFGNGREPDPEILRFSSDIGYPIIAVAGMFATALAIAVLSVQARRVGVFGKRLMIFSLVVAVITLASAAFIPLLAMLIWFFVVAGVIWCREDTPSGSRPVTD